LMKIGLRVFMLWGLGFGILLNFKVIGASEY
jgi:hypothetical protein